jgi:1,4-dihydroxy-2-naphthoyl-CoA hydrolase
MMIEEEIRERFEALLAMNTRHMGHMLGMAFEEVSRSRLVATMPVNENTTQPYGMLHGGASVALAESLASIGAYLNINSDVRTAVGLEINANHVRPVREGFVRGTAEPLHLGAGTQIWEIKIRTDDGRLVCVSRCTLAVVPVRRKDD